MRKNEYTHLLATNEIFDHFCGTMQANVNFCFTDMLTITVRSSFWVAGERPFENGTYLIYAYSCSLNKHAWLPSDGRSSFKVYLHIPQYIVFADCGGPIKSVQMRWLVQTLPWRPCAKSLLQISYLFLGVQQRTWPACIHLRSITRAFAQCVKVYKPCVKLSWCLVCLCICAVLQENLLLVHSVLIAYAHTRNHF